MKRILSLFLGVALMLPVAACSSAPQESDMPSQTPDAVQTPEPSAEGGIGKALVVYFSAQNHTEAVAQTIAGHMGADLMELVPTRPYTEEDLNWRDESSRVNAEHNDASRRDIALTRTTPANWEDYDVVFVGYPIWWGIAAWPVNNFVKQNDFTGKTVIPFCTSSSSGLGQSGELLAEMAGEGSWQTGRRFSSGASQSTVADWVNSLNLPAAAPVNGNGGKEDFS